MNSLIFKITFYPIVAFSIIGSTYDWFTDYSITKHEIPIFIISGLLSGVVLFCFYITDKRFKNKNFNENQKKEEIDSK